MLKTLNATQKELDLLQSNLTGVKAHINTTLHNAQCRQCVLLLSELDNLPLAPSINVSVIWSVMWKNWNSTREFSNYCLVNHVTSRGSLFCFFNHQSFIKGLQGISSISSYEQMRKRYHSTLTKAWRGNVILMFLCCGAWVNLVLSHFYITQSDRDSLSQCVLYEWFSKCAPGNPRDLWSIARESVNPPPPTINI